MRFAQCQVNGEKPSVLIQETTVTLAGGKVSVGKSVVTSLLSRVNGVDLCGQLGSAGVSTAMWGAGFSLTLLYIILAFLE